MLLLIVEDHPNDLRIASMAAEASGFTVQSRSSAVMARAYLEECLAGKQPLPDAMLVDLDLGYDSGFELLRHWHSHAELARIPMVVWTVLGEQYREICRVFQVKAYVSKGEDISVLRGVLSGLMRMSA